ncbi:response regulator [Fictibacillus iocasae]|uniref:Response regulator n=1 Tax=Fictibacillus iocasae TaxID=2715437 RepID=A0ABW2NHT9_9BACL
MQPIRLIIADDHALARAGVMELLEDCPDFTVIGEACNGKEAVNLTKQLHPDLILMDISMPEMNGFEATKTIKERFPGVKVVMMTVSDDVMDWFEALKRGAQGYLLKNLHTEDWVNGLRAFAVDEIPMSKEMAFRILQEFKWKDTQETPLSSREQEVLQLVAKGLSNKDISKTLFISEHTVKSHLKNILSKLQLANRVQLTSYAYSKGLV